jgi:hypothetical protein
VEIDDRRTRGTLPRCLRAHCASRKDIGCHDSRCYSRLRSWLHRSSMVPGQPAPPPAVPKDQPRAYAAKIGDGGNDDDDDVRWLRRGVPTPSGPRRRQRWAGPK